MGKERGGNTEGYGVGAQLGEAIVACSEPSQRQSTASKSCGAANPIRTRAYSLGKRTSGPISTLLTRSLDGIVRKILQEAQKLKICSLFLYRPDFDHNLRFSTALLLEEPVGATPPTK